MLRIQATPVVVPDKSPLGTPSIGCFALALGEVEHSIGFQTVTGPHTFSVFLKARRGLERAVIGLRGRGPDDEISNVVSVGGEWVRHDVTASEFNITEAWVRFHGEGEIASPTDALLMSLPQVEEGRYPTSPMYTPLMATPFIKFSSLTEAAKFAAIIDELLAYPSRARGRTVLTASPILKHPRLETYAVRLDPAACVAAGRAGVALPDDYCLPDDEWLGCLPVPLAESTFAREDWTQYAKAYDVVGTVPECIPERISEIQRDLDGLALRIQTCPDDLGTMSPRRFEEFVSHLLVRGGYSVELTRASKDGGVDIFCVRRGEARFLVAVQCKRNAPTRKVDVTVIRELVGTLVKNGQDSGIVVTSSAFTRDAKRLAREYAACGYSIELSDFDDVRRWLLALELSPTV